MTATIFTSVRDLKNWVDTATSNWDDRGDAVQQLTDIIRTHEQFPAWGQDCAEFLATLPENLADLLTPEAVQAATKEGLSFFWAQTHIGHSVQFVGQSWEDGGFSVDESGDPVRDVKGNTVAKFSVVTLDPANESHVAQCEEWFGN